MQDNTMATKRTSNWMTFGIIFGLIYFLVCIVKLLSIITVVDPNQYVMTNPNDYDFLYRQNLDEVRQRYQSRLKEVNQNYESILKILKDMHQRLKETDQWYQDSLKKADQRYQKLADQRRKEWIKYANDLQIYYNKKIADYQNQLDESQKIRQNMNIEMETLRLLNNSDTTVEPTIVPKRYYLFKYSVYKCINLTNSGVAIYSELPTCRLAEDGKETVSIEVSVEQNQDVELFKYLKANGMKHNVAVLESINKMVK